MPDPNDPNSIYREIPFVETTDPTYIYSSSCPVSEGTKNADDARKIEDCVAHLAQHDVYAQQQARFAHVGGQRPAIDYTLEDRHPMTDSECRHPMRNTISVSREYLEFAITALMDMDPDHVLTLPNGNQMTVYSLKAAWSALLR